MLSYLHYLILGLISTRSVTYAATENSNVGIDTNGFENGRIKRPFRANFVRLFSTVPQSRASFFIYAPIFYQGWELLWFVNYCGLKFLFPKKILVRKRSKKVDLAR